MDEITNNEIMNDNFVEDEVALDSVEMTETSEENAGFPIGAVIGGVLGTAAVAGITAAVVKNKDKIKNTLVDAKVKHDQKKLEKLEKKAKAIEEAKKKYYTIEEVK